jgi:flagellar biosynthesis/type III secretory pathway protein FliH
LTIHLLESGRFRPAASSRAFPGWTAREIHLALNEREVSYVTMSALRRVGRTLGAEVGTGPDDDPLLREERLQSRAEGRAKGHAEGRAKGHAEGRAAGHAEGRAEGRTDALAETRRDAVLQVLKLRGLPVSAAFPRRLAECKAASTGALVHAALECRDEADFLRLIRQEQH